MLRATLTKTNSRMILAGVLKRLLMSFCQADDDPITTAVNRLQEQTRQCSVEIIKPGVNESLDPALVTILSVSHDVMNQAAKGIWWQGASTPTGELIQRLERRENDGPDLIVLATTRMLVCGGWDRVWLYESASYRSKLSTKKDPLGVGVFLFSMVRMRKDTEEVENSMVAVDFGTDAKVDTLPAARVFNYFEQTPVKERTLDEAKVKALRARFEFEDPAVVPPSSDSDQKRRRIRTVDSPAPRSK